jgi:hypothetical protein
VLVVAVVEWLTETIYLLLLEVLTPFSLQLALVAMTEELGSNVLTILQELD